MRILKYAFILSSLLLVNSCKDNRPNEPEVVNRAITSISAKINGWKHGADKQIILTTDFSNGKMYAKAKISEDGKFELTNLDFPSVNICMDIYIGIFHRLDLKVIDNIYWSDTTVNYAKGQFDIYDAAMTNIGFISTSSLPIKSIVNGDPENVGDCFVEYIYCDNDVVIKGTCLSEEHNVFHYRSKCNVNLSFYKGWNKYVTIVQDKRIIKENNISINYVEYSYSNNEPDHLIWDYLLF